jgi:hypothetical protein
MLQMHGAYIEKTESHLAHVIVLDDDAVSKVTEAIAEWSQECAYVRVAQNYFYPFVTVRHSLGYTLLLVTLTELQTKLFVGLYMKVKL